MTRGMRPKRAASRIMWASPVVSIHPDHGGSIQLLPPLLLFMPNELAGVAAVADGGEPACAVVGRWSPPGKSCRCWALQDMMGECRSLPLHGSAKTSVSARAGSQRTCRVVMICVLDRVLCRGVPCRAVMCCDRLPCVPCHERV